MSDLKAKLQVFYNGPWYPLFTVLLVYIGHVTELDVLFMMLIIASLCPALLFCTNLRFGLMPMFSLLFTVAIGDYVPNDNGYAERFLNPPVLIAGGIVIALTLASLVYFCIRNRKTCNPLTLRGTLLGALIFCGSMLLNGAFSENYTPMDPMFVLMFSGAFLGVYLLFTLYMRFDKKALDYTM